MVQTLTSPSDSTPRRAGTASVPAALFINTRARRGAMQFDQAVASLKNAGVILGHTVAVKDPNTLLPGIKEAVAAGFEQIIVGGGDGTLSGVMELFAHQPVTLGVLPLGTGNHLARTLGLPLDLDGAAAVIARGEIARIDLGCANGQFFINTLSMGITDDVAQAATRRLKRYLGFCAYGIALLKVLPRHHHFRVHIEAVEKVCDTATHQLVIANGTYVGEHIKAGPDASINDGRLVVFTLEGRSRYQLVRGGFSVALGRHVTDPKNHYFETKRLTIRTEPTQRLYLDGEHRGETPAEISVVPRALRVFASTAYCEQLAQRGCP
ncbi:MAG: diacylglycerol/lipid kinase family protein [Thermomicrobiales bacterium]